MHARRVDGYFDHRTGHASRMAYCGQFVAENEKTPICVDADRGLNSSVGAEGFEPCLKTCISPEDLSIIHSGQQFMHRHKSLSTLKNSTDCPKSVRSTRKSTIPQH